MSQISPQPPQWARNFLLWFVPDELLEGVLGDLLEQFYADLEVGGESLARRRFTWNVVRFFHPSIFLRNKWHNMINLDILKGNLSIARRNMLSHPFHTFINLSGLSFAVAFVMLAFLFIRHERSFDRFHERPDRIFRLYSEEVNVATGNLSYQSAVTSIPLGRDLAAAVPAIRMYSRNASTSGVVTIDSEVFEEVIGFVDPAFLEMFDFPVLYGDKRTALDRPNSIVLSPEKALKFFGTDQAVGKTLSIGIRDSTVRMEVTAVVDSRSEVSSIPFDILLPFDQYRMAFGSNAEETFNSYKFAMVENYILAEPGWEQEELAALLTEAIQQFVSGNKVKSEVGVQPLSTLHFESEITGNGPFTDPQKLWILLSLASLVLVIAGINFITLSLSNALGRMREMGLRKTLGATKGQVRCQLVTEAFLTTFIAGGLGVLWCFAALPGFSELVDSQMIFRFGGTEFVFLLSLAGLVAIITGGIQSIAVVRKDTAQNLKGVAVAPARVPVLSHGLIVVQFALSVILIIGALGVRAQLQYIQHKDLGYNTEKLVEISMGDTPDVEKARQLVERFRAAAMQSGDILAVSAGMNNCREPWTELSFAQETGPAEKVYFNQVDPSYLSTMEIELVAGNDLPADYRSDEEVLLVNEALVRHFGWDDPLQEQLPGRKFTRPHRVIGVVKDYHFSSLHDKIAPLVLALRVDPIQSGITGLSTFTWPPNLYHLLVRTDAGDARVQLGKMEKIWQDINAGKPFVYHFVDEALDAKYAEETRWGKIMGAASIMAIAIAWMGLLSLMNLFIRRRLRETGIRKVLGATTGHLTILLSSRFFYLVLAGTTLACPVAWVLLSGWLDYFTYRIELGPGLLLLVGLAVTAASTLSIGWQSYWIANRNPVQSIRQE